MGKSADNLQGTLDLLVLRTLASGEPLHGYTIADRIHEVSSDVLRVEEGSLYPALHRMDEAGWVKSKWGVSEKNRRARYYTITQRGRRQLAILEATWTNHVQAVAKVLRMA
ncbi:MAG: PadR family transcriptional regulator [Vicinamibacterales bacterium]